MPKLATACCLLLLSGGCTTAKPEPEQPWTAMAVVPLERAAAAEIAAELSLVLRAARIVADQRTNSLVVTAETEAELSRVLGLVEALDVESTGPHP